MCPSSTLPRLTGSVALPVLMLGSLVGCATQPASETAAVPAAVFDLATQPDQPTVEGDAIGAAVDELTHRCMARKGWDEPAAAVERAATEIRPPADTLERRRREGYGLQTAARSRARGDRPEESEGVRSPLEQWFARLSASRQDAYEADRFGAEGTQRDVTVPGLGVRTVATEGCFPDAQRAIYGSTEARLRITSISPLIGGEIRARTEALPRYADLLGRWSTCMSEAGYPVRTPEHARQELGAAIERSGTTPALLRREVATAVADLACARQVELREGLAQIHREVARSLDAPKVRDALVAYEERAAAYVRAKQVLSGVDAAPDGRS